MRFAETNVLERLPVERERTIHIPLGLLGFERIKEYILLEDPVEAPFFWLRVLANPSLGFVVMSPFSVVSDYQPDIAAEDADYLELRGAEDAFIMSIVTLGRSAQPSLNLKGPVVLNRHTMVGKQVIPLNASEYPVQYPLPVIQE
ncbi:MAG: flagellar assembly protein FliW [Candidatus Omnitrophica bacterium]|nr:flagellar assembly protein FliW [Candidatus Omnitrophota bacterium]